MAYERDRIEYKGFTIRVVNDEGPEEPAWGGTEFFIACTSRSYTFGNQYSPDPYQYLRWGEGKWGEFGEDVPVCPPVGEESEAYDLYEEWQDEHSSEYTVWPFRCGTEHGPGSFAIRFLDLEDLDRRNPDGWIFVQSPESPLHALASAADPKRDIVQIRDQLVETYTQWANGDVWGYIIEDSDGDEVGACWGIYGAEDCIAEAKGEIDALSATTRLVDLLALRASDDWKSVNIQRRGTWVAVQVAAPLAIGDLGVAAWALEEVFGSDPTITAAVLVTAVSQAPERTPSELLALVPVAEDKT
jgi:hypothetical protein